MSTGGGAKSPLRGGVDNLIDDYRRALDDLLLSAVGGSRWVPRVARRMLYNALGASVRSAPGDQFRFAGLARHLTLGHDVYLNQQVFIEAMAPVSIGDGCALGMQVMILTSHHPIGADGRWGGTEGRPVTIGDHVWVGARATILPGTTIESDVVIAAGAVVTGRCESGGVYAGVPARRIRELVR